MVGMALKASCLACQKPLERDPAMAWPDSPPAAAADPSDPPTDPLFMPCRREEERG
jgi:hypothetical protein